MWGLPPKEARRRMIELIANFAPSMFAGHSMLCPYYCEGPPTGSPRAKAPFDFAACSPRAAAFRAGGCCACREEEPLIVVGASRPS